MNANLLRFSSICAALSAFTTIGIHSFIKAPATFEESLQIYQTAYYIFTKWWVIAHCVFVIGSIYGLATYLSGQRLLFANLGFTFYTAFGLTEILRMFLVLNYLRQLRDQYVAATDETLKNAIRLSLDSFNGIGNALFAAFSLFIILGNILIGIACVQSQSRFVTHLGYGLIGWGLVLIISLTNQSLAIGWIDQFITYFNLFCQPVIRLWIAYVLWRAIAVNNVTVAIGSTVR